MDANVHSGLSVGVKLDGTPGIRLVVTPTYIAQSHQSAQRRQLMEMHYLEAFHVMTAT